MLKVDMSPEAVLRRLRRVDDLREVCRTLKNAKEIETGKVSTRTDIRRSHKSESKHDKS